MTPATEQVFQNALDLLPTERAELIERLFHSFDLSADSEVDAAWKIEVEERLSAIDRGDVTMYTEAEVFARINKK